MHVANSEQIICFDVDDTLILWDENHNQPFDGCISIKCPHSESMSFHRPHKRHIEFLKRQHAKGYSVVVWSSGGTAWAKDIVESLGLEKYVDIVMSKPIKWVDDLSNPAEVLGIHVYLDEKGFSL